MITDFAKGKGNMNLRRFKEFFFTSSITFISYLNVPQDDDRQKRTKTIAF